VNKFLFPIFLAVLFSALAEGLYWLLVGLELPSEVSTKLLVEVLLLMVVIAGGVIWAVVKRFDQHDHRYAIAGIGLLSVGSAIAFGLLPQHTASGTVVGAVGVLPPRPGVHGNGFQVGVSTEPRGCSESVSTKFVVNGSPGYWSEHRSWSRSWLPFVIVLPGRYSHIKVGLGREKNFPTGDPQQANIVQRGAVQKELWYREAFPAKLDATIIKGAVDHWWESERPVIIVASADWITRRDVNECNLRLPALAGPATVVTLAEAFTCGGLDYYHAGTCVDSSPLTPHRSVSVTERLEVSSATSMVTGGKVTETESVPRPLEIAGSPGWKCHSPPSSGLLQISGNAEAENGTADTSVASVNDCQALATVESSTWHHDFLLVLLGALMGVGVHMLFEGIVESPSRRAHRRARGGAQGDVESHDSEE
jgi:hypothetical protein